MCARLIAATALPGCSVAVWCPLYDLCSRIHSPPAHGCGCACRMVLYVARLVWCCPRPLQHTTRGPQRLGGSRRVFGVSPSHSQWLRHKGLAGPALVAPATPASSGAGGQRAGAGSFGKRQPSKLWRECSFVASGPISRRTFKTMVKRGPAKPRLRSGAPHHGGGNTSPTRVTSTTGGRGASGRATLPGVVSPPRNVVGQLQPRRVLQLANSGTRRRRFTPPPPPPPPPSHVMAFAGKRALEPHRRPWSIPPPRSPLGLVQLQVSPPRHVGSSSSSSDVTDSEGSPSSALPPRRLPLTLPPPLSSSHGRSHNGRPGQPKGSRKRRRPPQHRGRLRVNSAHELLSLSPTEVAGNMSLCRPREELWRAAMIKGTCLPELAGGVAKCEAADTRGWWLVCWIVQPPDPRRTQWNTWRPWCVLVR